MAAEPQQTAATTINRMADGIATGVEVRRARLLTLRAKSVGQMERSQTALLRALLELLPFGGAMKAMGLTSIEMVTESAANRRLSLN